MSWRSLAVSTAVLLAAAGWGRADADDTVRLDGKGDAAVLKLGFKGEADSLLVRGWHGGGYRPAYRYAYHGYHHYGAYRYGGYRYAAYRYWYPRYYRPYYAGYYWPWRAWAFGLNVWPAYYYNPPVVVYSAPVYRPYYPATISVPPVSAPTILSNPPSVLESSPAPQIEVAPPPAARPLADGTYRYDGGPANPVPLPRVEPAPTAVPQTTVLPDGRVVSLPPSSGAYVYLAYGEKPAVPAAPRPQVFRVVKLPDGR